MVDHPRFSTKSSIGIAQKERFQTLLKCKGSICLSASSARFERYFSRVQSCLSLFRNQAEPRSIEECVLVSSGKDML
jgi:hypothetical protein